MNVNWGHREWAQPQDVASLLGADPAFLQRDDCLDAEMVRSEVGTAFPEIDMSAGVEPVNVWYIPGTSLQVVYRARGNDDAADGEALFRVRFHPFGESGREAVRASAAAADSRRVRHLPGMSAVAWIFPEDAELPHLGEVLNDAYMAKHLKRAGSWKLLSYLPGRRCAVRYRFADETAAGMVVRVQTPDEAAKSHGLARAAWRADSRRFRMPEPAGCDPRAGAFWESFAPGARLDSLLGTAQFDAAIAQVVEGIVRLHALRLPDLPRQGTREVLHRTTGKVISKARVALPLLRADLETFAGVLTAHAPQRDEAELVTLHGDLHTANLLIDGEGVIFIDLDRMSVGNPACDLALLGTRLLLVALHGGAGFHDIVAAIEALPDRYREAGGRAIDQKTFAWYVAALLVGRQVKTVIRHLAPKGGRLVPMLLAWARRTLEQGRFDRSVLMNDWNEVNGVCETTNQA